MKVLSLFNLKGGVGKTTSARNMGFVLSHHHNKHVLLVDCDSSGNLSDFFHLKFNEGSEKVTLSDLMLDDRMDTREAIYHTDNENLDIIPCNSDLRAAAKAVMLDALLPQQFHLGTHIRKIKDSYDFVIFDCPPKDDIMVINALACSQEVIIPLQINQDALAGANDVAKLVDTISSYNPALTLRGALMTMIGRNSLDQQGIALTLSYPKFHTYIHRSAEVEKSRCEGKSCWEFHKTGIPSMDYDNFVAEYLGLPPEHPEISYDAPQVYME